MNHRELFAKDLNRALLAASEAYNRKRFVVVGSSALLASFPDAPGHLRVSADIDMFPIRQLKTETYKPGDEQVGQFSPFQEKYNFYVERVGDWTVMTQPAGWLERCKIFRTGEITGYCLSPLDLAYNKTEAGRDKDISFVAAMLEENIIDKQSYTEFLSKCPHEDLRPSLISNAEKIFQRIDSAHS